MNDKNNINRLIDKLRFRTFNKVYSNVKQQYPNIEDEELRQIISERLHDKRPTKQIQRLYQVKIYSRFIGSWYTDLYDNLEGNNPRYWQIFINTNTRYAVVYPLPNKTKNLTNYNTFSVVSYVTDSQQELFLLYH